MQLGTRWAAGSDAPASVPAALLPAIAEIESRGLTGMWTLTWLEGRPIAELDAGWKSAHSIRRDHRPRVPGLNLLQAEASTRFARSPRFVFGAARLRSTARPGPSQSRLPLSPVAAPRVVERAQRDETR